MTATPGPGSWIDSECGTAFLPMEFEGFSGPIPRATRRSARDSPKAIHAELSTGDGVILHGEFRYIDAVYRYCQRF